MIYNIDEFKRAINSVLREIPFLYTEQLKMYLMNTYFGISYSTAEKILYALQRNGVLLLSPDGWAMTKGVYHWVCGDKFNTELQIGQSFRAPEMTDKFKTANIANYTEILDAIDCFWIVIDLLPNSQGFYLARRPWSIVFDYVDSDGNSKLYEIAKFNSINENIRREMFMHADPITDEKMRNSTTRIAVVENPDHAWKVPKIGFKFICTIDTDWHRMYRIVEQRKGDDIWDDEPKEGTT